MNYKERLYGIAGLCSKFGGEASLVLNCAILHYNRLENGKYDSNLQRHDTPEEDFCASITNKDINLVVGLLKLKQFYIDEYGAKF